MTITTLKILALIFMTIDHIGAIFFQDIIWLGYIGRLSAPIFIFCIAEALKHTSDRKKYVIKLFAFSLVTSLIFYFSTLTEFLMTGNLREITFNITGLLFQGALLICIIDMVKFQKEGWKKRLLLYCIYQIIMLYLPVLIMKNDFGYGIFLLGPLSSIFTNEGGILWIALFLVFYYSGEKLKQNYIIYCISVFIIREFSIFARIGLRLKAWNLDILSAIYQFVFGSIMHLSTDYIRIVDLINNYQWVMIFSIIFIMQYNGKYGKNVKKLFYIYYPLHIVVLYFISFLI